jgi:hypothetical protein
MSRTLPRTLQGTALHGRNDGFDSLLPTPSIYAKACPYAEASGYAEASLDKSGDKSLTHRRPTANGSPFGKLRAGRRLTQMNAVGLRQKQLATDVASHCAKASPYAPGLQETRRETSRARREFPANLLQDLPMTAFARAHKAQLFIPNQLGSGSLNSTQ